MTILLDTHCFLWWLASPERLSAAAREAIQTPANDILVSTASSWEIAIKFAVKKLALPIPPEKYVPARLQKCGFGTLRIEHAHALRAGALPMHHRDPFDRVLVAQAQIEKIPIITADRKLAPYEVDIIWT